MNLSAPDMNSFAVLAISLLCLSACTTYAPQKQAPSLQASIEIMQPKVDLPHLPRPHLMRFTVDAESGASPFTDREVNEGLQAAVECNNQITQCKHAIVLPEVHYELIQLDEKSATLRGKFDVTVGRALTQTQKGQMFASRISRSIGDSVEVIEEGKFSYPFSTVLTLGQPFTVEGRLGTSATFTLQKKPVFPMSR
jgi:hypothetical protein